MFLAPYLGLHSAAAAGNLGLVTYALDHDQPVNSVLDGALPLDVACSGRNDLIVRLLVGRGADVNAPRCVPPVLALSCTNFYTVNHLYLRRLSRKYSSDRHRNTLAPLVGSSVVQQLHSAAANGHEHVVLTLLLHHTPPDGPDK